MGGDAVGDGAVSDKAHDSSIELLSLMRRRKEKCHYAGGYEDAIDWAVDEIERLRNALSIAQGVCGRNHMNCPGSKRVKNAVNEALS